MIAKRHSAQLRLSAAIAIVVAVACTSTETGAWAATVDVVVDSTDIQLQAGGAGTHNGKLTLSNISDRPTNLAPAIQGDGGCSISSNPTSVQPGRRTQVTLTFSAGCEVERGADVLLALGSGFSPPTYLLKVAAAPPGAHWDILLYAFLIAAGLALAAILVIAEKMLHHNRSIRKPSTKTRRGRKRTGQVAEEAEEEKKEKEAKHVKLGPRTPLASLGTDWSFKDNWVGNVTIGSAALVALLAASNVLKAVLGAEPEAALGLLAVGGALAAVFVAIGPLLIKVIGADVAVPTIGGMLAAAFVTLVGTLGQITAVTWQGAELTTGRVHWGVIVIGAAIGSVVWLYAIRALWAYAHSGAESPPKSESETMKAAEKVAAAIKELRPPPEADGDKRKPIRRRRAVRGSKARAQDEATGDTTVEEEETVDEETIDVGPPGDVEQRYAATVLEKRNPLL